MCVCVYAKQQQNRFEEDDGFEADMEADDEFFDDFFSGVSVGILLCFLFQF